MIVISFHQENRFFFATLSNKINSIVTLINILFSFLPGNLYGRKFIQMCVTFQKSSALPNYKMVEKYSVSATL